MYYSSFGILALILHVIINYDVLIKNDYDYDAFRSYRRYLFGIMVFYVSDILWGFLFDIGIVPLVYFDTMVFFMSMAVSVVLWTRYVVAYLHTDSRFSKFLIWAGWAILLYEIINLVINIFTPVMFSFDSDGEYTALSARYVTLFIQLVLFLAASIYSFIVAANSTGKTRFHHRTIGMSGVAMAAFIILQTTDPLLPYYSIGCMLGTCLLHTFVLEDEKEERKKELEELLLREQKHMAEIQSARQMAYTDSLTGVKNMHSYFEAEGKLDRRIAANEVEEFGVIVFDLNDLKIINDTQGHDAGDLYIKAACKLICTTFDHSPVFRIGGDEFVVILEGRDYKNRYELLDGFDRQIEENIKNGEVIVSSGLEEYKKGSDDRYQPVFERADKKMYERKHVLKDLTRHIHSA